MVPIHSPFRCEALVVLLGGKHFALHRRWCVFAVVAALAAVGWYVFVGLTSPRWPGGGSATGLVFGISGGLIILFEFLLWPRKKVRSWRIGRAQTWLRAHIWLGLLSVPLIVLHGGVPGSPLGIALLLLFLSVIASGVAGLVLQQYLPSLMLEQVSFETIYSQISSVARQECLRAEELIVALCGADPKRRIEPLHSKAVVDEAPPQYVAIGAIRNTGHIRGKVLQPQYVGEVVLQSVALRERFYDQIAPYLLHGARGGSPLSRATAAEQLFMLLRGEVDPAAHGAIDTLATLCQQRRQWDTQERIHFWLYSWLWVHVPLSAALVLLMFVHIYYVLQYG